MFCKKVLVFMLCGAVGVFLCSCVMPYAPEDQATAQAYSHYLKGRLSDGADDIDEAIAHYKQAQRSDPQAFALSIQLGLDYIELRKYKEAICEFEKVVRLSSDENARYILAFLYVQTGDFKKAADQYEVMLEKKFSNRQQNIQLRRILSQLYFLQKDFVRTRQHEEELLSLSPTDEFGLYLMAMLDNAQGHVQEAEEGFKKVLAYYAQHVDAMNALAYLYAEHGAHLDRARDLATKAVAMNPSQSAYLDTLGWVYFKMGDMEKAVLYLQQAARISQDPIILNHLGDAYYQKGMRAEAQLQWQHALERDATQQGIREKLRNINEKNTHDAGLEKNH